MMNGAPVEMGWLELSFSQGVVVGLLIGIAAITLMRFLLSPNI